MASRPRVRIVRVAGRPVGLSGPYTSSRLRGSRSPSAILASGLCMLAMALIVAALMVAMSWGRADAQTILPTRDQVYYAILDRSWFFGADPDTMLAIAECESHMNPAAVSYGGSGLFQFTWGTWSWSSVGAGMAGASPYDHYAAAHVAAWLAVRPWLGGLGHWRACLRG